MLLGKLHLNRCVLEPRETHLAKKAQWPGKRCFSYRQQMDLHDFSSFYFYLETALTDSHWNALQAELCTTLNQIALLHPFTCDMRLRNEKLRRGKLKGVT